MASRPGILTEWPWKSLGNFKYAVLVPWVVQSYYYSSMDNVEKGRDVSSMLIFPLLISRLVHDQIWITLSRFQTARSKHTIVNRSIEFEQVDRERNWDDQVIFNGILLYLGSKYLHVTHLPWWNTHGVLITILCHIGPVEFIYYWGHRALHHHFLYSRYHSHHHSSFVTEPITSVIHPFAEHIFYSMLFAIPLLSMSFTGTGSIITFSGYITYIDFMNNMGHCNFEFVPKKLFAIFPFLKFFMYTPSYHSLHHTQIQTNYSLFMPLYDYIYSTMDRSSDLLYEASLKGKEEVVDMVHLTHPTSLNSIYHLRLGFASLASQPYHSKLYLWLLWPITIGVTVFTWSLDSTFIINRSKLAQLKMQTWAIPRYTFQYFWKSEKRSINDLIEKAILEADARGVKVINLGLLNQSEELNRNGELYVLKHRELNIKIVGGSALATAVVLNSIPQGTTQVLLAGYLSKTGFAIALALCHRGIKIVTSNELNFAKMKEKFPIETASCLVFSTTYYCKIWLVGDGLTENEHKKAPKGTLLIPFSQFPLKRICKDCNYRTTPAMMIPKSFENMHSCENWLPRRVMSAWHVGGIVHAMEGWGMNECGDKMLDYDTIWNAALHHGFLPFDM